MRAHSNVTSTRTSGDAASSESASRADATYRPKAARPARSPVWPPHGHVRVNTTVSGSKIVAPRSIISPLCARVESGSTSARCRERVATKISSESGATCAPAPRHSLPQAERAIGPSIQVRGAALFGPPAPSDWPQFSSGETINARFTFESIRCSGVAAFFLYIASTSPSESPNDPAV